VAYAKYGALNFSLLTNDKILIVDKEADDEYSFVPLTYQKDFAKPISKLISIGQHDKPGRLSGVGRRVRYLKSTLDGKPLVQIWEGQYKRGILNGFARRIQINHDGEVTHHIGFWKRG